MHSTQQARRPDTASHTLIQRFCVGPADIGMVGIVDGATLLEWIHKAGRAVAAQWSGRHCVAAHIANLHLDRPIGAGELVDLHASVVYTGRTSIHVLVTVYSRDPVRPRTLQTAQCPIVFVAVDDEGTPVDVEPWTPVTILDLQRHRQARVRIQMRKRIDAAMAAQTYSAARHRPSRHRAVPRCPHQRHRRRQNPRRSSPAVDRGGGLQVWRRMDWWEGHHVLRCRSPLSSADQGVRRRRSHRPGRPHRTAQRAHQRPRHHDRHRWRSGPVGRARAGRRRVPRRAWQCTTCPGVEASLRRGPPTRSTRQAPDRAAAVHRAIDDGGRTAGLHRTGATTPRRDRRLTAPPISWTRPQTPRVQASPEGRECSSFSSARSWR